MTVIYSQIQITSGELLVTDLSNNKYIGFDSSNQIIKPYKPIDLSGYVWKGTFYSSDKYNLNDLVIYDDLQVYICTEQPVSQTLFNTENQKFSIKLVKIIG